jgi:hypothetical protein
MATLAERYTQAVHTETGYHATWLPGSTLRIGDVGTMEGNVFVPRSDLLSLGIHFEEVSEGGARPITFQSAGGIDITAGGSADAVASEPTGETTVKVSFGGEGAALLETLGCRDRRVKDQPSLEQDIREALHRGVWDLRWVVVTQVVEAASATVLVADAGGAEVCLRAGASLPAGNFSLADANLGLSVTSRRDVGIVVIAHEGLTPLFRAMRLKKRMFSSEPAFEHLLEAEPDAPEVLFRSEAAEDTSLLEPYPYPQRGDR